MGSLGRNYDPCEKKAFLEENRGLGGVDDVHSHVIASLQQQWTDRPHRSSQLFAGVDGTLVCISPSDVWTSCPANLLSLDLFRAFVFYTPKRFQLPGHDSMHMSFSSCRGYKFRYQEGKSLARCVECVCNIFCPSETLLFWAFSCLAWNHESRVGDELM